MTTTQTSGQINVMVVDDSTSSRVMLRRIIESDASLRVSAMAQDAFSAAHLMKSELPDVILLDLEMPGMDGMTFLRRIMQQHPLPVVICSSLTEEGSRRSVEAMEAGAVDVIRKPEMHDANARAEATMRICDALHAAAASNAARRPVPMRAQRPLLASPKLTADEILPPPNFRRPVAPAELVVCIGASTGGTEALREVLCALTPEAPPIVVVQHMPKGFTAAFARRLDGLAQIRIREGEDGMTVARGEAIIAPGDSHMLLQRKGSGYQVQVRGGPYVSRHRPSVDVLFRSAAIAAGQNALGIILTGMGDDGAMCLGEMQRSGAVTIAQDEASSVVYGMPREAARLGHAHHILPLGRIAPMIMGFAAGKISLGGVA
ncbi:MAG: chemotaxis response regulator protein-glutamate methylesterase [Roseinatronobacter sp.]|nr:chemotaxis response regulator protein-glutamate methylesterase [Roseinatronobacter sp.]